MPPEKEKKETKTANLVVRVRPSIKARAEKAAKAEDRSLAYFIERLIDQNTPKR